MKNGNGKHCLNKRVDSLAEQVLNSGGAFPLVFLDTGAIIDFETEVLKQWKLTDSKIGPANFYLMLGAKGFPIYVTNEVMEEVGAHYMGHRVNGNPEISSETMAIILSMNDKYHSLLKTVSTPIDKDAVRYHAY